MIYSSDSSNFKKIWDSPNCISLYKLSENKEINCNFIGNDFLEKSIFIKTVGEISKLEDNLTNFNKPEFMTRNAKLFNQYQNNYEIENKTKHIITNFDVSNQVIEKNDNLNMTNKYIINSSIFLSNKKSIRDVGNSGILFGKKLKSSITSNTKNILHKNNFKTKKFNIRSSVRRSKKSKNIGINLIHNKDIDIDYKFLLDNFEEPINESCYFESEVKNSFIKNNTELFPKQKKLTFGRDLLSTFYDLTNEINRKEKENIENPTHETLLKINELSLKKKEIEIEISRIPIIILNTVKKGKKLNLDKKIFQCNLCVYKTNSGQALGGHMSKKHPKQSKNFKNKCEIREKRRSKRDLIEKVRRLFFTKYNIDYDEYTKTTDGRRIIKQMIRNNKEEYIEFKKEHKK